MRGRVIVSIMLCFLLGSRCPAHGLCLAAAQQNCGKDRSGPWWVIFPHSIKGERAVRMLPCPQVSRAATDVESTLEWHRKCLFTHISFCNCCCIAHYSWREVYLALRNPMLGLAFIWSEIEANSLPVLPVSASKHSSSQHSGLLMDDILRRNPIFIFTCYMYIITLYRVLYVSMSRYVSRTNTLVHMK